MIERYWEYQTVFFVTFISGRHIVEAEERRRFSRYFSFPTGVDNEHASQLIRQYLPNVIEVISIEEVGDALSMKSSILL